MSLGYPLINSTELFLFTLNKRQLSSRISLTQQLYYIMLLIIFSKKLYKTYSLEYTSLLLNQLNSLYLLFLIIFHYFM